VPQILPELEQTVTLVGHVHSRCRQAPIPDTSSCVARRPKRGKSVPCRRICATRSPAPGRLPT
jgi:hypothetical protein